MTTKLRVRYDGSTLVPLEPVDFPAGSVLDVELSDVPKSESESAQRVLNTIWSHPKVDSETIDELIAILASGRVAGRIGGVFDHLAENDSED
jgi:predicted DNA-binding antitoxin AbrB/MazE fold protein